MEALLDMEYIKREAERKFREMSNFFKAVLVTGARQVGKTTMLKKLADGTGRTYVSLDDIMARELAQSDPALFFQKYKPPVIIDEVQYAPQLFERIKVICDSSDECGLFWLTGSQQYDMMKNVRETLAGRVGIMNLYSLSQREKSGVFFDEPLDFSFERLCGRQDKCAPNNISEVFEHIWRGGMPHVQQADEEMRQEYFNSYVDTYLMRDVAEAGGVTDSAKFLRMLRACAALTAEQVNYANLAQAADISEPTAKEWVRLLHGLGIIYLLQPYLNNELKRLAKTPKLYFCDTGLCAFLSMWLTKDTLMNGAASGHYYENYVVNELVRSYAYGKKKANLYYYRDSNAKEIDIIAECDGKIHPLEVKKSANPDRKEVKKYELIDKASLERSYGGIVCMCDTPYPIDELNSFIPSNLL